MKKTKHNLASVSPRMHYFSEYITESCDNLNHPSFWDYTDWRKKRREIVHEASIEAIPGIVAALLKPGDRCMEYGCGYGRMLYPLVKTVKIDVEFIGIDFNEQAITSAPIYTDGCDIHYELMEQSRFPKIPFPDKSIDFVFSNSVMIHNDRAQIEHIFREFDRVLKPGGRMLHDFILDSVKSRAECKKALLDSYPLYCYKTEFVRQLPGFTVSNFFMRLDIAYRTAEDRCIYIFEH